VSPRAPIVAIDGPSGAGKSASARGLAERLGLPYLDTGAMYRAVGLAARRAGVVFPLDAGGEERTADIARTIGIVFSGPATHQRVTLDGEDVTLELRRPEVSQLASMVSACSLVRRELVRRQRELAAETGGVVEGRDIGTVVFPDAAVKVFLTAAPEVRARRRLDELRKQGVRAAWEEVLREQRERDERDSTRTDSPLRPADGAVILDTSAIDLDQVISRLLAIVRRTLDTRASGPV
jgi:cytidylate kinase